MTRKSLSVPHMMMSMPALPTPAMNQNSKQKNEMNNDGFTTPPSCNYSDNPFTYMPQAPAAHHRLDVDVDVGVGVGVGVGSVSSKKLLSKLTFLDLDVDVASKKLLSKRIFLDLDVDDHDDHQLLFAPVLSLLPSHNKNNNSAPLLLSESLLRSEEGGRGRGVSNWKEEEKLASTKSQRNNGGGVVAFGKVAPRRDSAVARCA